MMASLPLRMNPSFGGAKTFARNLLLQMIASRIGKQNRKKIP
jgi:hypothetical protein